MLTWLHAFMFTCLRAYMLACLHAYTLTRLHAYMLAYLHTLADLHICIHTFLHTYILTHLHTHILTYLHTIHILGFLGFYSNFLRRSVSVCHPFYLFFFPLRSQFGSWCPFGSQSVKTVRLCGPKALQLTSTVNQCGPNKSSQIIPPLEGYLKSLSWKFSLYSQ